MNKKPKRKRHLPTELEAVLLTPPDLVAYYLREEYQLENFLNRLENEAKNILKRAGHSTTIGDISRSLKQNPLPYCENEEYVAYLLLAGPKLRKALSINDAREAVIQTWVIVSAATYAGMEKVITQGISTIDGRSKGGQVGKKLQGIMLAVRWALKVSKHKGALSLWRFLKKEIGDDERTFGKYDIGFDENKNCLFQMDRTGEGKEIRFRAFQNYVRDLKK